MSPTGPKDFSEFVAIPGNWPALRASRGTLASGQRGDESRNNEQNQAIPCSEVTGTGQPRGQGGRNVPHCVLCFRREGTRVIGREGLTQVPLS